MSKYLKYVYFLTQKPDGFLGFAQNSLMHGMNGTLQFSGENMKGMGYVDSYKRLQQKADYLSHNTSVAT